MLTKEIRLRRIQRLAHEIMDEMDRGKLETLHCTIVNLVRAIGDFADPIGHYSLDSII